MSDSSRARAIAEDIHALYFGYSVTETVVDRIERVVARELASKDEELDRLRARVAELTQELADANESLSMSCESPRDNCTCAGCRYANEVYAKEKP